MRTLICSLIFFAFAFTVINTVYDFGITTVDGEDVSFAKYQGKKILIVVLPSTHTAADSLLLQQMDTMSIKYRDSLTIVGIPSYEDGYQDDSLQNLAPWYKSLAGDSVVLAQGMNTRKNSAYQTELFAWLTDK